MTRLLTAAVFSVLVVAGHAQQTRGAAAPALANPVPVNAQSIAAGKQVFDKYCKFCHGPDAKGNGPLAPQSTHPPDLTDANWEHGSGDGDIYTNIREGIGPKMDMKGFKSKLTDKEMWSVVNYVRSLGPPVTRR